MAIADFAELGLEVVSTGVKEATNDLEKLATTAEKTEKATSGLSGGFKTSSDSALSFSEKAKALDSSLVNNLMSTFEKLQNPILAFSAGLLAAGTALAALGMKSISFADDMNDLAIATGKTFLELQTLGAIADKNGTSMQAMQTTLDKVAVNMAKASNETSKQAQALKYFDVALVDNLGNRKTEAQLAYEVAAAYDKSNHSASATAAAQQILTSNFREQLPAILALNTAQDEANKLKQYGAVVDKELAAASDTYNDTLTDIGNILKGVGNDIARTMLPLLQSMADTFVDSATNGGILEGVLTALKVAFEVVVGVIKGVWSAIILLDAGFQAAGKTIGAFGAAAAAVFSGNFAEARTIIKLLDSDLAKLEQDTKQRLTSLWTDLKKTQEEIKNTGTNNGNFDPNAAKEAAAAAREAAKEYEALQKQIAKLTKEQHELEAQTKKLENAQQGIIDTDIALIKVVNEYNSRVEELASTKKEMTATEQRLWDAIAKSAIELDKARELTEKTKVATKELNEELAAEEKLWKAKEAAINAINTAETQYQQSLAGQVQSLEDSNRLLGLNAQQQKIVIEHKKIDAELSKTLAVIDKQSLGLSAQALEEKRQAAVVDAQIAKDAVTNAIQVGDAMKQSIADAQTVWGSLGGVVDNFFQDLLNNGTKSFKNLGEALKKWFIDVLYQMTIKKWVVNITAATTASASGVAGASTGAGGFDLSSLFSGGGSGSLSSIFSSFATSAAGVALGLGETVATSSAAAIAGGLSLGVEAGATAATGALTSLGSAAAAAIPYVGAIVAVGMLAYSFLGKKGGGPKEGGFATSGDTPGINGTDSSGRWMTPNQSDANMLTAVNQMTNVYNSLLNALGGTGSAVFAQGYSTDPKGTAPSNVHTGAWVNGSQVFDSPNGNVGRSSEDLQAELELQSKRALLAALQSSELPDNIAEIIDSIAPESATGEAIDRVLALAQAIQQASELLDIEPWKNLFANMDPSQVVVLSEAFGGMQQMMGSVSEYMNLYYTDAEKMQMATASMTQAFDTMGVAMPTSIQGFRDLVEGIDKTTPAGAALFAQLMEIAPSFYEFQTALDSTGASVEAVSAYMDMFYTDAEKVAMSTASMTSEFNNMGVAMPTSIQGFRDLVDSIDKTTPAGAALFAQLMEIAPEFFNLQQSMDDLGASASSMAAEMSRAARQLLSDQAALADIQGRNGSELLRNGLIDIFASGRDWAQELLASGGYNAFAANLGNITQADFANYSSEDRALILEILRQVQNSSSSGSNGGSSGGSYSGGGSVVDVGSLNPEGGWMSSGGALIWVPASGGVGTLLAGEPIPGTGGGTTGGLEPLPGTGGGTTGGTGGGVGTTMGTNPVPGGGVGTGSGPTLPGGGSGPTIPIEQSAKELQLTIQLLQLEGKTREAVNMQREQELESLSASEAAIQKRIWELQDEAKVTQATSDIKTRILQAQAALDQQNGVESAAALELLNMQREKERAEMLAIDASLGPMLDSLYALEDELYAMQQAAQAAAEAAQQAATMMNLQIRLAQAQGNSEEVIRLQREAELAAAKTEEERQMLLAIYAAEDAARAAAAAAAAQQEAAAAAAQAQAELEAAAQKAANAAEQQKREIENQIEALDNLAKSTRDYVKSLQELQLSMTNPSASLSMARAAFLSAKTEDIPEAGNKYLEAVKQTTGSRLEYLKAIAQVINVANAAAETEEAKANTLATQIGLQREGNESLEGIFNEIKGIHGVITGQAGQTEEEIVKAMGTQTGVWVDVIQTLTAMTNSNNGGPGGSGWMTTMPIPALASGGDVDGGWALVGEEGPELVQFPHGGRVHPARQSATMLAQNTEFTTTLQSLVKQIMENNQSISKNTEKTAKILQKFDSDGLPPTRT